MHLFNLVQAQQIHSAEVSAERANHKTAGVEARVAELETRFNRLALISEALWDLLKDRHGYTEEELRDWVTLTDLKDGKLDGRVRQTTAPVNCVKCNRIVSRAFARCMYCDEPAASGGTFDRVR
jgi:hypothetical protein